MDEDPNTWTSHWKKNQSYQADVSPRRMFPNLSVKVDPPDDVCFSAPLVQYDISGMSLRPDTDPSPTGSDESTMSTTYITCPPPQEWFLCEWEKDTPSGDFVADVHRPYVLHTPHRGYEEESDPKIEVVESIQDISGEYELQQSSQASPHHLREHPVKKESPWIVEYHHTDPSKLSVDVELRSMKQRFFTFPAELTTRKRYRLHVGLNASDSSLIHEKVSVLFGLVDSSLSYSCDDIEPRASARPDRNGWCCFRVYLRKKKSNYSPTSSQRSFSEKYRLYVIVGKLKDNKEKTVERGSNLAVLLDDLSSVLVLCMSPPFEIANQN